MNNLYPAAKFKPGEMKVARLSPRKEGLQEPSALQPVCPGPGCPLRRPGSVRGRPPPAGLRRGHLSPAPRPHSLFLRKRSSCSTAMALTQSRAACSSEYRVKAMVAGNHPESQLICPQPSRGTWRRHCRCSSTAAGKAPNALSEKLRPPAG